MSASRYAYMGGFDGTSNVLAGQLFGVPVRGTHAHAFVSSFRGRDDLPSDTMLVRLPRSCSVCGAHALQRHAVDGSASDLWAKVCAYRPLVKGGMNTNEGELVAFTGAESLILTLASLTVKAYALAFPTAFLALIDTYHTLHSGLVNFAVVALALNDFGYKAIGARRLALTHRLRRARHSTRLGRSRLPLHCFPRLL